MFNYEIKLFVLWLITNVKLCDYNFMKKQNKRKWKWSKMKDRKNKEQQ